jgi:hypothetical protein
MTLQEIIADIPLCQELKCVKAHSQESAIQPTLVFIRFFLNPL